MAQKKLILATVLVETDCRACIKCFPCADCAVKAEGKFGPGYQKTDSWPREYKRFLTDDIPPETKEIMLFWMEKNPGEDVYCKVARNPDSDDDCPEVTYSDVKVEARRLVSNELVCVFSE